MHSVTDDPYGPGFPIRKSQDQSSVTSSPGHIAGSNVLHRLSTPRHPPCALGPVIIPTRHRRIGTSLSQAMLMSQLVRLTLHRSGMPFRTSHLRIYDLPSWSTLDPLSSRTCSAWGGRIDRQIVSNHAVVKEQLVALFPQAGCHLVC